MMTWLRSALHLALALSLGLNLWLAERVWTLQGTFEAMAERPVLSVGSRVPDLDLLTVEGKRVAVRYSESPELTLVYVVSPTCKWCASNRESIRFLANALSKQARVVGIAIMRDAAAFEQYVKDESLPFPLYNGLPDSAAKAFQIRSTPSTYLVSKDGVVLAVWEGAYGGTTKSEMETRFKVTLPTLGP
jgi:peroxiredoxin